MSQTFTVRSNAFSPSGLNQTLPKQFFELPTLFWFHKKATQSCFWVDFTCVIWCWTPYNYNQKWVVSCYSFAFTHSVICVVTLRSIRVSYIIASPLRSYLSTPFITGILNHAGRRRVCRMCVARTSLYCDQSTRIHPHSLIVRIYTTITSISNHNHSL